MINFRQQCPKCVSMMNMMVSRCPDCEGLQKKSTINAQNPKKLCMKYNKYFKHNPNAFFSVSTSSNNNIQKIYIGYTKYLI